MQTVGVVTLTQDTKEVWARDVDRLKLWNPEFEFRSLGGTSVDVYGLLVKYSKDCENPIDPIPDLDVDQLKEIFSKVFPHVREAYGNPDVSIPEIEVVTPGIYWIGYMRFKKE